MRVRQSTVICWVGQTASQTKWIGLVTRDIIRNHSYTKVLAMSRDGTRNNVWTPRDIIRKQIQSRMPDLQPGAGFINCLKLHIIQAAHVWPQSNFRARHWPYYQSPLTIPPSYYQSTFAILSVNLRHINRLRGRVVKGVEHLDHVWSYGEREVVSSIPIQFFILTRWLVRFSHLKMPFLQNSEFI